MRRRGSELGLTGILSILLIIASVYAWTRDDTEAQSTTSTLAQVERGRALFLAKGCAACHHVVADDIVVGMDVGPELSRLPEMAALRVDGQMAEDYVRTSVLSPDAYAVPGYGAGFGMPQIQVGTDELDALVAYLLDEK